MLYIENRIVSIMVVYAVALHLTWTGILLFDKSALTATPVAAIYLYVHPPAFLITIIFSAAVCATVGLVARTRWVAIFLLPQQILLMMSAAGAVEAIWLGHFADGVIRSRAFLACDQIYSVLAAIGHTIAIMAHARRLRSS